MALRVTLIKHAFDEEGPVLGRAPFGDGDVTAPGQRFDFQKDFPPPRGGTYSWSLI